MLCSRDMTRRDTNHQPGVGDFHQHYALALTDGRAADNLYRPGGARLAVRQSA